jgi:hypothetical protein
MKERELELGVCCSSRTLSPQIQTNSNTKTTEIADVLSGMMVFSKK